MKQAFLKMRVQQAQKREAILEGLEALGYKLETRSEKLKGGPDNLIVTWNLHGEAEEPTRIRRSGGTVIVVENPYVKTDLDGNEYLAMAVNGHNGSGLIPTGDVDRLAILGVEEHFEQWKTGEHILVIGQRGIGSPSMRSPAQWGEHVTRKLAKLTERKVIHRPHPGRVTVTEDIPPLDEQLKGAHCVVMWASNCATTALMQGIPVFYDAPSCVLRRGCRQGWRKIEDTKKEDKARLDAFWDLSYAQWNLDEIRTGYAFNRLIECKS